MKSQPNRKKVKWPGDIEELRRSDFKIFLELGYWVGDQSRKIYTRHKYLPQEVIVFWFDGIHFIDRVEISYDFTPKKNKS